LVPRDLGKVAAIAAGGRFCAVIRRKGGVVMWGHRGPVPAAAKDAVSIGAGWGHCVALLSDGSVLCWGDDHVGQCRVPPGLGRAISVAAGGNHTVALLEDGSVVAWGGGFELDQATQDRMGPVQCIAAGARHFAVLGRDGQTRVWGVWCGGVPWPLAASQAADLLRWHSRALRPSLVRTLLSRLPVEVVVQIPVGVLHRLKLLSDGRMDSVGIDVETQCDETRSVSRGRRVAYGAAHSVTLSVNGSVTCDGRNFAGQCDPPDGLPPVIAVAAGCMCSAALSYDGRLWLWGRDCVRVPWVIPPQHLVDFLYNCDRHLQPRLIVNLIAQARQGVIPRVDSGYLHAAVLLPCGRTRVWGRECHGLPWDVEARWIPDTLRTSGTAISVNFGARLINAATPGAIRQYSAGFRHGIAVLEDGRVSCWGRNVNGECAVPSNLGDVVAVAAGGFHSIALTKDRTVVCWGCNWAGQCEPPCALRGRAVAIHAEGRSSWAVDVKGKLHAWGRIADARALPFSLTKESWLGFASRTSAQTKRSIYPADVRRSAEFRAMAAISRLASG
jgi:alpha-tubulin suppressor-like RCC1 family protein